MAITPPPKLEPIPLPPPPTGARQWGKKAEIILVSFLLGVYNSTVAPFLNARNAMTKYLFQTIEDELKPVITPLLDRIDSIDNLPPEIRRMTKHLRFSEPLTFAAIAAAVIVAAIVGLAMGFVQPLIRKISQETDHLIQSGVMPIPQAFGALKRGSLSPDKYRDTLKDAGWSEELKTAWEGVLTPRMTTTDLSVLLLRGLITQEAWSSELARRGYEPVEIGKLYQLLQVIPPLSDIIRMAVREAFTPAVVSRFQLHAELPADMVAWAKKQGLSEDWARAYWAAHWELPSLTMGFEMLHRGVISDDDMRLLIRTHDVSPFWRDKLLEISYSPYTRVDVRRMYEAGILTIQDVYRSYRDIGYNHEKATNMTTFTVALSNATERDLTKSEVLAGFKIGYFTRGEANTQLLALGYDQTEADYYVSKVLYDLWQAEIKEQVKYISQQYIANQIDETEAYALLGKLNLPAEQVNRYIREWNVKKDAKTRTIPVLTLVKFLSQGVISHDDFANEMSGLGYSNKYIEWYINSAIAALEE